MAACPSCGAENRKDARFCDSCGAALSAAPARESRKTVTVLFCDVTGSTALGERIDPESLRNVMSRYFETAKEAIERHGGTVEKFIGDAVMAVFGVPVVHEDDALRAVRAADDLLRALVPLNEELEQRFQTQLQLRIGVNTGEVVTGTAERLATGDAVNVAARLEQSAQPGQILLGEETIRLLRGTAEVEPTAPVAAKGKSDPLAAYRLVSVDQAPGLARRDATPMVGRKRQRQLLDQAFANIVADKTCHLFTVLGAAGVGKSRLVGEFLQVLAAATVVSGRCLSYGEGISYFPVTEAALQLRATSDEHPGLGPILGEDDAASSPDEIAWAFRKLLETRAAETPLVVVFDDIHWGEPTFLDLVEHIADFSREAPILLLCMARPELLDRREAWGGGKLNATNVLLEPLAADEADELLTKLLPAVEDDLRERILHAAEGNPLFVEEMVAMVAERQAGRGDVRQIAVPPTIQALLAARLDQLDAPERIVLERGAVEGNIFHRGVVEALAPGEPEVPRRLMSLVRKELVRPDRTQFVGDDAFRFRHLLIRDAAYDALPKSERADLHEAFAAWLEARGVELVELHEILGYHLEQAWRYRQELGAPRDPLLAAAARERLAAAARRALLRSDFSAGLSLTERALALVSAGELDLGLEIDRLHALFYGGDVVRAYEAARALVSRTEGVGDRVAETAARIELGAFALYAEPEGAAERLARLLDEALPELEREGDPLALCVAHFGRGQVAHLEGKMEENRQALERSVDYARRVGLAHYEAWVLPWVASARFHGPSPLPEFIAWVDEREAAGFTHPVTAGFRCHAIALLGDIEQGRAQAAALRADLAERGASMALALSLAMQAPELERLAGNPAGAVELSKRGCAMFEDAGERAFLSTAYGFLGAAYLELGDLDAAEKAAKRGEELGASDDVVTQMIVRQVQAKVLARRGEFEEAERLAREAVALDQDANMPISEGEALEDLAYVLSLAGKAADANRAIDGALANFETKGAVVLVDRARRWRAEGLAGSP